MNVQTMAMLRDLYLSSMLVAAIATTIACVAGAIIYWIVSKGARPTKVLKCAIVLYVLMIIPGILFIINTIWAFTYPRFTIEQILMFALALFLFQYLFTPVLVTSKTRNPYPEERWLYDLLEEVKARAGYRKKVKLKIADFNLPNAYAVSNIFTRTIILTRPLLEILTPNEIKAVIAHELGHIKRRDTTFGLLLSSFPMSVYAVGFTMMAIADMIPRPNERSNPLLGLAGMWVVVQAAFALFTFFAYSRAREHLADIFSVQTTGTTDVIKALAKLQKYIHPDIARGIGFPNPRSPYYIIPMLYGGLFGFAGYFRWARPVMTHPPYHARKFIVERYLEGRVRRIKVS